MEEWNHEILTTAASSIMQKDTHSHLATHAKRNVEWGPKNPPPEGILFILNNNYGAPFTSKHLEEARRASKGPGQSRLTIKAPARMRHWYG